MNVDLENMKKDLDKNSIIKQESLIDSPTSVKIGDRKLF